MNTVKLNQTNLSISEDLINEVEAFLGKEIESVYSYVDGEQTGNLVSKAENVRFRAPFYDTKSVNFDFENEKVLITWRNRYARQNKTMIFPLVKVGFKLPTTKLGSGYIYKVDFSFVNK